MPRVKPIETEEDLLNPVAEEPVVTMPAKAFVPREVNHHVRLISLHSRYRGIPFQFTVAKSKTTGMFVTGQQDILSYDKMIGKERLTDEERKELQMGASPYVINPDNTHYAVHNRKFDLSYRITGPNSEKDRVYINPKDYAEFKFFMLQPKVCYGKENYQKNKHAFYFEDKEQENLRIIEEKDLRWQAESFVRSKLPMSRWSDIIMLLNYEISTYSRDASIMTENEIRADVLQACENHPKIVLKLDSQESDSLVFVLKLLRYGMVTRQNMTDFYAGSSYIGGSLESVIAYCHRQENSVQVSKWSRTIESKN